MLDLDYVLTMNKDILRCVLLMFIGSAMSCNSGSTESNSESHQVGIRKNDLPDMRIRLPDQSEVDIQKLKGKVLLIFFQPECDHCQREATEIAQNITAFKNASLYFITSDTAEKIERFATEYKLYGHVNIIFGHTSTESVLRNFGPIATPSIYIYSAEQRLIKAFNGEVAISEVFKYI